MNAKESTYTDAMQRLEEILESIDDPRTGIDTLAEQVREASGHLKTCRAILTRTEEEITSALDELQDEMPSKEN